MDNLSISLGIQRLAGEIFDADEWSEVQKIVQAYSRSRTEKGLAILRLQKVVPTRPKRPLYYVNYELKFLPKRSRFVVEQIGSYLDLAVKELRYELEGQYQKKPLGVNVAALMKSADTDMKFLLRKLEMFNEIAYVPSKHIYGPPYDQRHYFNTQETIVIVLAAIKLGEELKKRSQYVRNLCQDLVLPAQKPLYGNWKRTDRNGAPFDFKKKLIES